MTYARLPGSTLDKAFALPYYSYIFLIGGGGKTTLMFTMAHHLANAGWTVVSTTSTKIICPTPEDAACVIVEEDIARAIGRLRTELSAARHVVLGKMLDQASGKLHGYSAWELDDLRRADVADYLIVEADGSAGKSLKSHIDREPVVSAEAELVIAVIGSDCIGATLTDAHVHRAKRFGKMICKEFGTPISVKDVAAIFFSPGGYLKSVSPLAQLVVFISKAGSRRATARQLAAALWRADEYEYISRIVIGELSGAKPFLEVRD